MEKIIEIGDQTPKKDINSFCEFASIDVEEIYQIAEKFRNKNIWEKRSDGFWFIKDFIIKEWDWSKLN